MRRFGFAARSFSSFPSLGRSYVLPTHRSRPNGLKVCSSSKAYVVAPPPFTLSPFPSFCLSRGGHILDNEAIIKYSRVMNSIFFPKKPNVTSKKRGKKNGYLTWKSLEGPLPKKKKPNTSPPPTIANSPLMQ